MHRMNVLTYMFHTIHEPGQLASSQTKQNYLPLYMFLLLAVVEVMIITSRENGWCEPDYWAARVLLHDRPDT
jgi:hypothetical protein